MQNRKLTRRQLVATAAGGTAVLAAVPRSYAGPKTGTAGMPAILGGQPVRTAPFPHWPNFRETDEKAVLPVLRSGVWSRANLPAIWDAASTTNQDRKRLLRMAIDSVQLDGVQFPGQMEVQIRWRTDTITRLMVARPIPGEWALRTPTEAVSKIHSLAGTQSYAEIAEQLNREGIRTAFGRAFNAASVRNICRRDGLTNRQKTKKIPNLSSFDPGQCPKT